VSGRLVGRAIRESRVRRTTELAVLMVLAEHARDDGSGARLAMETLARETRISKRQAIRVVQALVRLGEVTVLRSNGRTNVYHVHPGGMTSVSLPTGGAGVTPPVTSGTRSGDIRDIRPVTSPRSPLEPYEPDGNRTSRARRDDPHDAALIAKLRRHAQLSRDPLTAANARERLERMGLSASEEAERMGLSASEEATG